MDYLADELRRAIDERGRALADRVQELRGRIGDERLALGGVLDLFACYPEALATVVELEWNRNPAAHSRVQLLRPLLRHTTDVANFVNDWLAHSAGELPLYLLKAVERACDSMSLDEKQAVLAPGPADNFTTVVADISSPVFDKLGPLCPPIPSSLTDPNFVLIRVPRLEGASAWWHPILLGHELAHLAVREHDALGALDLQSTFDFATAANLDVPGAMNPGPASALRLFEIAESWAKELICDAFAVRTFGSSAVSALGEYLETIAATDFLSDTHPPGRLRNYLLTQWLGPIADPRLEQTVASWRELAAQPLGYSEDWAQFVVDTLLTRGGDIRNIADAWPGETYDTDDRARMIATAADQLFVGIPPESTLQVDGHRRETLSQDVVAAAWLGRVEDFSTPIDDLATKSLDTLQFMHEWGEAGGSWPIPRPTGNKSPTEGATLTAEELTQRLSAVDGERLVVSPLLPDYAAGSSLDLRLGNTFIVFLRSHMSAFNPLDQDQDPRQVQRKIQLQWGDSFVLHPAELVLASTLEYLVLPRDLCAQVVSRSSYGRLGLLSATAVQVHPNFHGCLTLELVNLGTVPLVLTPGERIAQLVVSPTTETPPSRSRYHFPTGPEFSKVRSDMETEVLRTLRT